MALPDQNYHIPPEKWPELLTDDLKAHFERVGEESVQWDVSNHRYREPEKQFAALYWLGQKREARQRQSNRILLVALATLIAALGSILVTIFPVQSNPREEIGVSQLNDTEQWTLLLYWHGNQILSTIYPSKEQCMSAGRYYIEAKTAEQFDCGLNCGQNDDPATFVPCEKVCNTEGCR